MEYMSSGGLQENYMQWYNKLRDLDNQLKETPESAYRQQLMGYREERIVPILQWLRQQQQQQQQQVVQFVPPRQARPLPLPPPTAVPVVQTPPPEPAKKDKFILMRPEDFKKPMPPFDGSYLPKCPKLAT